MIDYSFGTLTLDVKSGDDVHIFPWDSEEDSCQIQIDDYGIMICFMNDTPTERWLTIPWEAARSIAHPITPKWVDE